jgi:hypothetical protein
MDLDWVVECWPLDGNKCASKGVSHIYLILTWGETFLANVLVVLQSFVTSLEYVLTEVRLHNRKLHVRYSVGGYLQLVNKLLALSFDLVQAHLTLKSCFR